MDKATLVGIFSALPEDQMINSLQSGGISFSGAAIQSQPKKESILETFEDQRAVFKEAPRPTPPLLDPLKMIVTTEAQEMSMPELPPDNYESVLDQFQYSQGMGS